MLNITDHTQILGLMAIEKCKLYEPSPGFCSFEKAPLTVASFCIFSHQVQYL